MAANQKLTNVIKGRILKQVRQQGALLHLDFEDGSTMEIQLAEETSSVMVRDGQNRMEYAD